MDKKELKVQIGVLNDLGLEGIDKLKVVGVKIDVLKENFMKAVEAADEAGFEKTLPNSIVDFYNVLRKEPTEPAEPAGKKDKSAGKKDKPADKKDKPAKEKKPLSRYGHQKEALSGKLDDLLYEGHTVAEIMKAIDVNRTRVMGHSKHLRNDLGLTVVETKSEAKDAKLNDTHMKVKEETYTAPAKK